MQLDLPHVTMTRCDTLVVRSIIHQLDEDSSSSPFETLCTSRQRIENSSACTLLIEKLPNIVAIVKFEVQEFDNTASVVNQITFPCNIPDPLLEKIPIIPNPE